MRFFSLSLAPRKPLALLFFLCALVLCPLSFPRRIQGPSSFVHSAPTIRGLDDAQSLHALSCFLSRPTQALGPPFFCSCSPRMLRPRLFLSHHANQARIPSLLFIFLPLLLVALGAVVFFSPSQGAFVSSLFWLAPPPTASGGSVLASLISGYKIQDA